MARIEGVDLPRDKQIEIALTYIYGIGRSLSQEVLDATGVDGTTRVKNLTEGEVQRMREYIGANYLVEGELRSQVEMNIKRLRDIGTYRGMRHRRNLPVRGQRTKTNARTRRGPRRTVAGRGRRTGAGKK